MNVENETKHPRKSDCKIFARSQIPILSPGTPTDQTIAGEGRGTGERGETTQSNVKWDLLIISFRDHLKGRGIKPPPPLSDTN